MKILIGSDPEVFVKDIITKQVSSVIGLLGGTKEKPKAIGNYCHVQEDNILAEFNIPPCSTKEDFLKNINYSKDYISTFIAKDNLELHYSSSEIISENILSDERSKLFGCSPSINILTESISQVTMDDIEPPYDRLRTAGFHIHFGYDNPSEEMNIRLVLAFELMVSLPLARLDVDMFHRRKFYGHFGDCRFKPYGVECRSLGGYFLKNDNTISEVWDKSQEAIKIALNNDFTTEEMKQMLESCVADDNKLIQPQVQKIEENIKMKINSTKILK